MLHEFIADNRDTIIAITRARVQKRSSHSVSPGQLEHGVPVFLRQLVAILQAEVHESPMAEANLGASATKHGSESLGAGFSVTQVIEGYGDICQAITELAVEAAEPIAPEEFQTLNHCLDIAIAKAVTEHTRITAQSQKADEVERLGNSAHEARDLLNSAFLAFQALKRGNIAINGSTGAVLGRSLMGLRDLTNQGLSTVRLDADITQLESVPLADFITEIANTGMLHAEYRQVTFTVGPVDHAVTVDADPQLLSSAITNLLSNAFKFTAPGGRVALRTYAEDGRLRFEVEDEGGGIPADRGDLFAPFSDRRGRDRSGLGMGLSIARKAVQAHGGDITVASSPGRGCVFTIDVPMTSTLSKA